MKMLWPLSLSLFAMACLEPPNLQVPGTTQDMSRDTSMDAEDTPKDIPGDDSSCTLRCSIYEYFVGDTVMGCGTSLHCQYSDDLILVDGKSLKEPIFVGDLEARKKIIFQPKSAKLCSLGDASFEVFPKGHADIEEVGGEWFITPKNPGSDLELKMSCLNPVDEISKGTPIIIGLPRLSERPNLWLRADKIDPAHPEQWPIDEPPASGPLLQNGTAPRLDENGPAPSLVFNEMMNDKHGYQIPDPVRIFASDATIFIAAQQRAGTTSGVLLSSGQNGSSSEIRLKQEGNKTSFEFEIESGNGGGSVEIPGNVQGTMQVYGLRLQKAPGLLYGDTFQQFTPKGSIQDASFIFRHIGAGDLSQIGAANHYFRGAISEILVYPKALGDDEMYTLQRYLKRKHLEASE